MVDNRSIGGYAVAILHICCFRTIKRVSAALVIYRCANSFSLIQNPSQVDIKRLVGTPFEIRFLYPYIILHSQVVTKLIRMPYVISLLPN